MPRNDDIQGSGLASARATIESMPFPVFIKGRDGRYLACNQLCLDFLGPAAAGMVGRRAGDFCPPDLAGVYETQDAQLWQSGGTQTYDTEVRHADGSLRQVRFHKSIYHDDDGKAVGLIGILLDVTAEKRAQAERELMYRQMFETNVAVKLLIDPKCGQIVDANDAAARFYGWSHDQLCRMKITDINALPPAEVHEEMRQAQSENRLFFRFPHRTASGDLRSVEVYTGPVTYHGRELLHSIIVDVTDRERALTELRNKTEALEQSNADLQQFAYVASHDLQEPLRTVVSYLQLLMRRYHDKLDAEAQEFMDFAVDGAKRMSQLIQDLLTYSRVDSQGAQFECLDSAEILDGTLANLRYLLNSTGGEVVVEGKLPPIFADAAQIASVFQNLIGNALKYRHPDRVPVIRISAVRAEAGQWLFTVADNGIGIAPEYHDRIFKIFQRLHSQGRYPGTGIGLALVRRIISRHGGEVWVESQDGEGAAFKFTLPGG
jgi:PAS domain S-box-containing protein